MEKLMGLLNEYDPYIASDGEYRDNLWGFAYQGYSAVFPKELAESYIISARYGFIKWLVENEKIDMKKHFYEKMSCVGYSDLNIVLCELAIQDEPINFLISILK